MIESATIIYKISNNGFVFQFSCYDHDDDGSHDFIGYFTLTLTQLRDRNADHHTYELINPKKLKKKKYENSGGLNEVHTGG